MRRKLQNHSNKGKGKEKRKSEEKERRRTEKKATVADSGLVFIIATLEIDLLRKNCGTQTEGPFGDNVSKVRLVYTSDFFRPRNTRYN